MSITLGHCWRGLEDEYVEIIRKHKAASGKVVYVEIGVSAGITLSAISNVLDSKDTIVGIDVPEWGGAKRFPTFYETEAGIRAGAVSVLAVGSHKALREWPSSVEIDVLLIDGCHCKECCELDFILAEPVLGKDCTVVFHDCAPVQQGTQEQYGHGPIAVLDALDSIGLADGSRPGWKKIRYVSSKTSPFIFGVAERDNDL